MHNTSTNYLLFKFSANHSEHLGLFHLNGAMLVELNVVEFIITTINVT
jgi:hypothetical protein